MDQNIQVFVRCRPLKVQEKRSPVEVIVDTNEVKINDNKSFYFDKVFDVYSDQQSIYSSIVKPLINQVLLGFNCTVFAYGQTGTGKTYTMEGDRSTEDLSWEDDPHSGIIPRAISQLFDTLKDHDSEFSVRVSFLELYNEDTYDLLSPIDDTSKLKIFDDAQRKGSVIVDGLEETTVESKAQIYDILKKGSAKRQTAATLLNACSSRSHTIFTITVNIEGHEMSKTGKLNLVDLAGSENIARSGLHNKHAREAGNINQSLLTLTRVITALVEKRPHIPYRESKLTRILQDSLGGNTKTSMIATISVAEEDLGNTIGTLDYASRARRITNKPDRQLQRKPSDIDIEAFKSELEFQIRNEVALEFRRETEKIREEYKRVLSDKNELLFNTNQSVNELQDKAQDMLRENAELRGKISIITSEKEELDSKILLIMNEKEELAKDLNLMKKMFYDRDEEIEKLRIDLKRSVDDREAELTSLREKLDGCRCTHHDEPLADIQNEKKAKRAPTIRKQVPINEDEVNDYANMTFDNDDEIVQVSAKKPRRQIVTGKKATRKELTMSGRKKRLRETEEDDVSLSPISPPIRVTRARATRRKLAY